MRIARNLLRLMAMAATALALAAASASAQETPKTALTEAGDPCGTVVLVVHDAQGGCHITFQSDLTGIPLHVYIPAKTTIANCFWQLEGQIDTNGEGWIDDIRLSQATSGTCTRTECDEAEGGPNPHDDIPWPFHVVEHSSGEEELELVLCLRPVSAPEGVGAQCEIHLEFSGIGGHDYEVGHGAGGSREVFCENNPPNGTTHPTLPFPVSLEGHLTTEGTEESGVIEVIHE